jgi:hypothetical protein
MDMGRLVEEYVHYTRVQRYLRLISAPASPRKALRQIGASVAGAADAIAIESTSTNGERYESSSYNLVRFCLLSYLRATDRQSRSRSASPSGLR